jgi:hypothetical protein
MTRMLRTFVTASALIITGLIPAPAFAQTSGGVLKVHHQDSPASTAHRGGRRTRIMMFRRPAVIHEIPMVVSESRMPCREHGRDSRCPEEPKVCRLAAGAKRIRTAGPTWPPSIRTCSSEHGSVLGLA